MKHLRIVHAIRTLDPKAGGPTEVCRRLASAQAALGHSVSILAEVGAPDAPAGVTIRECQRAGIRERLIGGKVTRAAVEGVRGAGIVHLHGVWDPFLHIVASASRTTGVPYVVMPHGMLDPWSMAQKKWKKRIAMRLGTRRMLNRAAGLHLLYPEEGVYARALGVTTRGEVIPNGVSLSEIDPVPSSSDFRNTVPGLEDRPYILFLGRLHHKKGLDYLADAFASLVPRFPEARLVVAGADDGMCDAFKILVAQYGLTDRVHLVGPVYGRLKWSALAGCAGFVLPSRQEGFSVAVLEALACRRPVVISDQCHFAEVSNAGAGAVVPLNPAAIADALAPLLADPERGDAMGMAGRALVESRYTWNRVAEATQALYLSCKGGKPQ